MKCRVYNAAEINEYIDNELTEQKRHELEKHLSSCGYCRAYYNEVRKGIAFLKEKENYASEVPGRIWFRVKEKLERKKKALMLFRVCLAPAAVAAVLLIFNFTFQKDSTLIDSYLSRQMDYLSGNIEAEETAGEEESQDFISAYLRGDI